LKPAFLAVTNMQVERPELIARNSERVLTARLRDARFFWDEDRKAPLENRIERLSTILFHKKLGSYKDKAERIATLAAWLAGALGHGEAEADARRAGRLAKADLATDMVRELTELQGTMGGIYAREDGLPESVWKAIYFHYLPIGVDADAPPAKKQLGSAAVTWAAVSLADKFDSAVGMFIAGERPTGSRDPLGLRRQAQGAVKILTDLPGVVGAAPPVLISAVIAEAAVPWGGLTEEARAPLLAFLRERVVYLFEQRGFDVRNIRAVLHTWPDGIDLVETRQKLEALASLSGSTELHGVAGLFKRVKNISKDVPPFSGVVYPERLVEPAEQALASEVAARGTAIEAAAGRRDYRAAFSEIAALQPSVAKFFDDVLVMAEDAGLREARLGLVATLRDRILRIADISEIVEG
jgi:glycyl-tRNA synthetase beta chain